MSNAQTTQTAQTRLALGIEYAGSAFHGWQSQPHGQTVQDVLEQALNQIAASATPIRVHCAGRTDAGVHALNQVVHFDTQAQRPLQAWVRGVNALLPPSVCVRWAQPVAADFHARFAARARHYVYLLHNHPVRPALLHDRVGWHHRPLDVARMQDAAQALLGEHDFSAFRAAECQARSPIKHMWQANVRRQDDLVIFEFRASAFLQHMVRNLVGSLVAIGNGRAAPDAISQLLASRDRRQAAPTFPAAGLYLLDVDYAPEWNIPASASIMPALFNI